MKKKTLLLSCLAAASLPVMAQAEVQVTSPRVSRPAGGAILPAQVSKGEKKEFKVEQKGIKVEQKAMKKEEQKVLGTRSKG